MLLLQVFVTDQFINFLNTIILDEPILRLTVA